MDEISSIDELEKWLQGQPVVWARVLAFRCSIRVIPVLNEAIKSPILNDNLKNQLTLSVFRSSLISGVAVYIPPTDIENAAYAARNSADTALGAADIAVDVAIDAAADVARAAAFSAYASCSPVPADAAHYVASAAYAAYDAFNVYDVDATGTAFKHDISLLRSYNSNKKSYTILQTLPLWKDQVKQLVSDWRGLRKSLLSFDVNWQFWIDWYQAKLDGSFHPGLTQYQQEDLYYQIATFPNEFWEEGAEVVNQRIAELLDEIKKGEGNDLEEEVEQPLDLEIPPQNEGALQFKTNEDGIIELDQEAIENELLNDQDAIDRHNEVDYLANELISSYDPNSSSANAARPIVTKVQRYLEALGDTPEETNINFIIPRGEVLRQELEIEENRDEFTNSPPLPDNFKSALSSLVSAHNLYVLLDPVLDERDQARLGPDAKKNMISAEKGHQIVLDALNFGIIKDDTEALIAEDLDLATTNPGPESRVARRASENIKNFVKEILSDLTRKTKPFFRASGKIMGATTVTGLMLFREEYTRKKVCLILKHRDWFIKSFGVNPSMKRMMEEFIQYLEGQSILNDKDKSS